MIDLNNFAREHPDMAEFVSAAQFLCLPAATVLLRASDRSRWGARFRSNTIEEATYLGWTYSCSSESPPRQDKE